MKGFLCFTKTAKREWLLFQRQPKYVINALLFFLMCVLFFPLTLPPDPVILRQIAPGLVWLSLLFALLLGSEHLFQQDYEDGTLEQWVISGYSLGLIIGAKLLVSGLVLLLPLLFLCPLLGLIFNFSLPEILTLLMSLILSLPTLFCICALAASFGIKIKQKGIFMALILLPLTIPILIFASAALTASMQGLAIAGYMAILLALAILTISVVPAVIAVLIKISFND